MVQQARVQVSPQYVKLNPFLKLLLNGYKSEISVDQQKLNKINKTMVVGVNFNIAIEEYER